MSASRLEEGSPRIPKKINLQFIVELKRAGDVSFYPQQNTCFTD